MIFDSHCHLNDDPLYNDISNVLQRAKDNNVNRFVVVGWDYSSSLRAVELAEKYDCCYAAVGYHPCDVENVDEAEFTKCMALLSHPKVVALGEIGLDYYWVKEPDKKANQKAWFIRQIKEADKAAKPIIIHNRESTGDCLEIIKENIPKFGGVVHCFSSSVEVAKEFIKLGLYISVGGTLTFKNSRQPKEVAEAIDLSYILVETDCPYLTPHPFRGKQNEPSYIPLVVTKLAEIKNTSVEEVERITYENTNKLFHV